MYLNGEKKPRKRRRQFDNSKRSRRSRRSGNKPAKNLELPPPSLVERLNVSGENVFLGVFDVFAA